MMSINIYGAAIVFNYLDEHGDIIHNKAKIDVCKTLAMKWEHKVLIGTWNAYYINQYGLFVEGITHEVNPHLTQNICMGKLSLSVGFYITQFQWISLYKKQYRLIHGLQLIEVSLTQSPANNLCGCMLSNALPVSV
jgi:phage head maturation protease